MQGAELLVLCLSSGGKARESHILQVLEVVAEEEAPLLDYEELLQQHPSEITQDERERQKQFQQDSRSRIASAEAEVGSQHFFT